LTVPTILLTALVSAFILIGATALPAAADAGQTPFKATFAEHVAFAPCPFPIFCFTAGGTGQASHMGRALEQRAATFDFSLLRATGCSPSPGTSTLTAANGDQVIMSIVGTVCSTGPSTSTLTFAYVVTGGTGRFEEATGSGTGTAHGTTTGPSSGIASIEYNGAISAPGAGERSTK
jgi:hypothetical protein